MSHPQRTFVNTTFTPGSFCAKKRDVVWENTLPYQLNVLKETGRYDAFDLKYQKCYDDPMDHWPVPNHLFWDSDVGKWLEGACYFLHERKSKEIEDAVDDLVNKIRSAQQPDGYLNIHFTVVAPKERFSNLRDLHELYNAGHLVEAAVAHHLHYGNDKLLEPLVKYMDLFSKVLGPEEGQKHGYPGHPEIELALLRLYSVTKDPKHLKLAQYFIDERGNPTGQDGRHFYTVEAEQRDERECERPRCYPDKLSYWYQQAHQPIIEQTEIQGHSVRAMYLLTAVADLQSISEANGKDYRKALEALWSNMVEKKMYMTGGIGAIKQWEGFGINYFLPQGTDEGGCYAETCASIGAMMLAERLLQLDLDSKYADIMELSFYNAMLTGMSVDGKRFTYVNQLASSEQTPAERAKWFTCACCPPNVTRTMGYLGGYFWSHNWDSSAKKVNINVHMYGSAKLSVPCGEGQTVELTQTSDWPWDGDVQFELSAPDGLETSIHVRVPGWAKRWTVRVSAKFPELGSTNLEQIEPEVSNMNVRKGYLQLTPDYLRSNPKFTLHFPMSVRYLVPHPYTNQNTVALARGPIVYCVEDVDNPWVKDHFKVRSFSLCINRSALTACSHWCLTHNQLRSRKTRRRTARRVRRTLA